MIEEAMVGQANEEPSNQRADNHWSYRDVDGLENQLQLSDVRRGRTVWRRKCASVDGCRPNPWETHSDDMRGALPVLPAFAKPVGRFCVRVVETSTSPR